ncbi:hypothetical protein NE865_07458 [Phthorimaea operculella]|nr:hypothetical protein NE865_07458 [Phthorimaea operculella]
MMEHGNVAVNWKEWKSAFDYYLIASGRSKASSTEKCAVFLHVIGKYGREVYEEFEFDSTEYTYEQLVEKFKQRFDPAKNVNFERHLFFETYQKDRSFDNYLSDLKIQSKSCEFGTLKNSLILTQMIRGLRDSNMRERLLAKSKLDLDEAAKTCRTAERASAQAVACSSGGEAAARDAAAATALEELAREYLRRARRPVQAFARPTGRRRRLRCARHRAGTAPRTGWCTAVQV